MRLRWQPILVQTIYPSIILGLLLGIVYTVDARGIHPLIGTIIGFFICLSLVGVFLLKPGVEATRFLLQYTVVGIGRFFSALIFMFVHIYMDVVDIHIFVGSFFAAYFLYLVFEIYFLLTNLHRDSTTTP
jgi:hypothetical protein